MTIWNIFKNLKREGEIRFTSAQTDEMYYKNGSRKSFDFVFKFKKKIYLIFV